MWDIGSGMWSNLIRGVAFIPEHSERIRPAKVTVAPDNLIGAALAIQFSLI